MSSTRFSTRKKIFISIIGSTFLISTLTFHLAIGCIQASISKPFFFTGSFNSCLLPDVNKKIDLVNDSKKDDIHTHFISPKKVYGCNMTPVGTLGSGYSISIDPSVKYDNEPSLLFTMKDAQKNRAEMSTFFATTDYQHSISPIEYSNLQKIKDVPRVAPPPSNNTDLWSYDYAFQITSSVNGNSKGIISQWHGINNRTTIEKNSIIYYYGVDDFVRSVLSKMYFVNNIGYDINTHQKNGYFVDQGGYPPLSLGFRNDYLYVKLRTDTSRVTDKTDKVNVSPPDQNLKISPKKTKSVILPYIQKIDSLPKNQWINLHWLIKWSTINGNKILSDGAVMLFIDNKLVLNWKGKIGNNDARTPYFKYGIYKTNTQGLSIRFSRLNKSMLALVPSKLMAQYRPNFYYNAASRFPYFTSLDHKHNIYIGKDYGISAFFGYRFVVSKYKTYNGAYEGNYYDITIDPSITSIRRLLIPNDPDTRYRLDIYAPDGREIGGNGCDAYYGHTYYPDTSIPYDYPKNITDSLFQHNLNLPTGSKFLFSPIENGGHVSSGFIGGYNTIGIPGSLVWHPDSELRTEFSTILTDQKTGTHYRVNLLAQKETCGYSFPINYAVLVDCSMPAGEYNLNLYYDKNLNKNIPNGLLLQGVFTLNRVQWQDDTNIKTHFFYVSLTT